MIKYIILKAVQVLALVTLPILMFGYFTDLSFENYFLFIIDLYILELYIEQLRLQTLEKELHGELY